MNNRFSRKASRISQGAPRRAARAGFTLIEMLVALSILMLMLAIIFVPLNLGINFFHMGRARAEVQQAAQLTLNQIEADLRQATFVFPNDVMPGITDQKPYTNDFKGDTSGRPYFQGTTNQTSTNTTPNDVICGNHTRVSNTSRIDFVLPQTAAGGGVVTPVRPAPYIVSYYVRRLTFFDASTPPPPNNFAAYDSVDNPLVLFRAQMPVGDSNTPPQPNANPSDTRYPDPSSACPAGAAKTSLWLTQSNLGEPNMELLAQDGKDPNAPVGSNFVSGTHQLITPRGMGLIAPHSQDDLSPVLPTPLPTPSFVPETSFICEDTNGDGKIDRVKITLSLGQFDTAGAQPTAQSVRLSDTIDLPNVQ